LLQLSVQHHCSQWEITAAEESIKSSYNIEGAGTTVTQEPDPTNTMASQSFAPADKATPPCGFTSSC
jgi:hypothetical protein